MPSQSTARRPHSSPQLREDAIAISTPKHSQSASPARFRPVAHARIREQGPSTKARFKQRKNLHQNYSGFHPKPARQPKRTASEEQLATTLSAQLQANIQDATNNFSAQIVRSANVLAENATDAVAGDIQSAVGAISDAVANTASNIEANVEGTVKQLGVDFDAQVAKYLSPRNIEKVAIGIVRNLAHVAVGAQHLIMSSEHPNDQDERDDEGDPLLPARKKPRRTGNYVNYGHWNDPHPKRHAMQTTRDKVKHFLSSKVGHYSVLTLVSLDVAGIIAGKSRSIPFTGFLLCLLRYPYSALPSSNPRLTNISLHNLPLQMQKTLGKQRLERSPLRPRHRRPRLLVPLHA